MTISIGTSGWSYPGWEEKLYGQKLSSLEQLKFYAAKFNSVEINYSFYHIPKAETFKKWNAATPNNFTFSVKLNRQFTHDAQLVLTDELCGKLKVFLYNAGELGKKFSVLLIQTPKSMPYNLARLRTFLEILSKFLAKGPHIPHLAFEFRNEGWFNEEVYDLLKSYGSSLVISQSARYPEKHIVLSNLIYIRFHGPEKMFDSNYSHEQLGAWKNFIDTHPEVTNAYLYFNNTMRGQAIDNALYLQELSS